MRLEYQLLIAIALDFLFGDPRWLPHPVQIMGRCALILEKIFRALLPPAVAGFVTVLCTLLLTALTVLGILQGAIYIHPLLGEAVSILLLYTCLATRDLIRHSNEVYQALVADDLAEAKKRVGMIVGRDTENLDQAGVAKAAVESVAESMVDGVTAPLFFALLGGPLGAMLYKAINTMDSTFGYKNEQYAQFGWTAARLDDAANFVPARLTSLMLPAAAFFLRLDFKRSLFILFRDRLNHASPNSGHSEAAVAGALGIQLGGSNIYFGKVVEKPTIGDRVREAEPEDIPRTNGLMLLGSCLMLLILLALRVQIYLLLARLP